MALRANDPDRNAWRFEELTDLEVPEGLKETEEAHI
jgi:hypothetical protein